ncbi:MAG TPA: dTDP-glucose 4,6-dehydratase [Alphaproteobacteria bacterium]|nr:dTDP-glucose 4,6-dehydratase [Rhodospirillaceae bacterium]HRJ12119.1 dTDP-glucose 4,6-dehydratase [Alphaproteobacteria bacterium]
MILVTGCCGFIGAQFVRQWLKNVGQPVIGLDALTYAGNIASLFEAHENPKFTFVHGNICDADLVAKLLQKYQPWAIINFAAESHVDRSITGPKIFVDTNVMGTFTLLDEAQRYRESLPAAKRDAFRYLQISTDEVFGSLGENDAPFHEESRYMPNSPYAASKASSDHLVKSFFKTYGFPAMITNCSNNYGPGQFPEKLIPLMITRALANEPLPVYGNGRNKRDWLYVLDHCDAVTQVLFDGEIGESYCIGGESEYRNIDVVETLCDLMDKRLPLANGESYRCLIQFVQDRPGHDWRYATSINKIQQALGWSPKKSFETGLAETVDWYLDNAAWMRDITERQSQNLFGTASVLNKAA